MAETPSKTRLNGRLSVSGTADSLMRTQGEEQTRKAMAAMPERREYKEFLAEYLAARNRYAGAIELYVQLTADAHKSSQLCTLENLQEEAGDYAGAIETTIV